MVSCLGMVLEAITLRSLSYSDCSSIIDLCILNISYLDLALFGFRFSSFYV